MGVRGVVPHLVINGASEAIAFYKQAFDAVEHYRMTAPDGKRLWHAQLGFGPAPVMLADAFPEMSGSAAPDASGEKSVVLHLEVENCDASFNQAVAAGATAVMPPTDMFWGDRYAQVVDPFGHKWSIAHPIEKLTPDQMLARANAAAAEMAAAGKNSC